MLLNDESTSAQEQDTQDQVVPDGIPDFLATRESDPEPLRLNEFVVDDMIAGFEVLDGEELDDCATAVVGDLVELLTSADCSQIVRTTLVDTDEQYVATVGVANLADTGRADTLHTAITNGVDGAFTAMRTDGAGSELGLTPTVLGFSTHGHYLLYAVIGRTDGETPSQNEPVIEDMVNTLMSEHLPDVLASREV